MFQFSKFLYIYITEIYPDSITQQTAYTRDSITDYFLRHPLVLLLKLSLEIDESLFGSKHNYNRVNHHLYSQN